MATLKVIEEFDGRLPVYSVICEENDNSKILKSFDTYEEADKWCNEQCGILPCGEEDPSTIRGQDDTNK